MLKGILHKFTHPIRHLDIHIFVTPVSYMMSLINYQEHILKGDLVLRECAG